MNGGGKAHKKTLWYTVGKEGMLWSKEVGKKGKAVDNG
jgi:hypothetical protein